MAHPHVLQVVVAIFSFYVCLYGLFKIVKPSSSPEPGKTFRSLYCKAAKLL